MKLIYTNGDESVIADVGDSLFVIVLDYEMTYYMRQNLFNTTVFSIAFSRVVDIDQNEKEKIIEEALSRYRSFYKDDDFEDEAFQCALKAADWIRDVGSDPRAQTAWMNALVNVSMKYEPNGKKKPWRLLNGLRYTSDRAPPFNRTKKFFESLAQYYMSIQSGRIPI